MAQPEYYSPSDVTTIFHVKRSTVDEWLEQGYLETFPQKGKRIRITPESVERMKEERNYVRQKRKYEEMADELAKKRKEYETELKLLHQRTQLYRFVNRHHKLYTALLTAFFDKIIAPELPNEESQALAMALSGYSVETIATHFGRSVNSMTRTITRAISRIRSNVVEYQFLLEQNRVLSEQNTNLRNHYRIIAQAYEDYKERNGFPMSKWVKDRPERKQLPQIYLTRLTSEKLKLSYHARKVLTDTLQLRTLGDLVQMSKRQLLETKGIGRKTVIEIDDMLATLNLRFSTNLSNYEIPQINQINHEDV